LTEIGKYNQGQVEIISEKLKKFEVNRYMPPITADDRQRPPPRVNKYLRVCWNPTAMRCSYDMLDLMSPNLEPKCYFIK
jgi:hypothetical protein